VVPIPKERVIETPHETVLTLNGREFLFLDTPGHARHHVCIVDRRSGHIFSGDTFGLSYREMGQNGQRFIFPTTTPIQFDPQALHRSIDLLLSFEPEAIYVTHYSQVRDVEQHADDLHRLIDAHVTLARRAKGAGQDRHAWLRAGLTDLVVEEADRYGCMQPQEQIIEVWAGDIELNAQGLGVWLDSRG
jgi:hydroxyacylglutathione hydrolase